MSLFEPKSPGSSFIVFFCLSRHRARFWHELKTQPCEVACVEASSILPGPQLCFLLCSEGI